MSPIHSASLVHLSLHSKQMLELLKLAIDRNLIDCIVQITVDTVANSSQDSPSTSQPRGHFTWSSDELSSFTQFVSDVISRSEVTISVLLVALVYIERSKPYLAVESQDFARERVFLGGLILASKFTNDSTLMNVHWARISGVFGRQDIGRIEREFLDVLAWDLNVSESDFLEFHDSLMALHPRSHCQISSPPVEFSPAQSEDYFYWSDSDSEGSPSSSSAPLTPSTPSEQVEFGKSPRHHKRQTSSPLDQWNLSALHIAA